MVFQFSNSVFSIFDPGEPIWRSQSTLKETVEFLWFERSRSFTLDGIRLFLSTRAENIDDWAIFGCLRLHSNDLDTVDFRWRGRSTYILSTSGLRPCILPTMVPLFEFLTHPLIPAFAQLSRQYFVNPTPEIVNDPSYQLALFDIKWPLWFALPWTWPNTSKSHWTNKFESSIPITFCRRRLWLCHHSTALKLQLTSNWTKAKLKHTKIEFARFLFWFLGTSLSPTKEKSFLALGVCDIFRLNFPIRLTLINTMSLI